MTADGGGPARGEGKGHGRGTAPGEGTETREASAAGAATASGEATAGGEETSGRGPGGGKPGATGLDVDLAALDWQRSGADDGAFEVAFVPAAEAMSGPAALMSEGGVQWVLLRVAGDPAGRVLVYDRTEWLCFLDGAANGEFDWAAELDAAAL